MIRNIWSMSSSTSRTAPRNPTALRRQAGPPRPPCRASSPGWRRSMASNRLKKPRKSTARSRSISSAQVGKLPKLTDLLDASAPAPAFNPEISGITGDSRLVQPGALFVALPGGTDDGRTFIEDAVSRGAAAIVTDPETAARLAPLFAIPVQGDANPRRRLAL